MTPPGASGDDPNAKTVMIHENRFGVFLLQLVAEGGRHLAGLREVTSFKGHIPLSDLRLTWTLPDTQLPEDLSGGAGHSQGFGSGCAPGKSSASGLGWVGGGLSQRRVSEALLQLSGG